MVIRQVVMIIPWYPWKYHEHYPLFKSLKESLMLTKTAFFYKNTITTVINTFYILLYFKM